MKKIRFKYCILLVFLLPFTLLFGQEKEHYFTTQLFRGNIYKHADYVGHLITNHPSGFLLSYNIKTKGKKEWQQVYNYPDYGFSFHYVDFKNNYIGVNYAVGIHYNFFFLHRNLLFRFSQGIALTSNPYNKETNNKNNAFGTKILANTYFLLQYQKQNIINRVGVQAGFLLTHFSNGRFKAPNSGVNVWGVTLGVNYNLFEPKKNNYITTNLPDTTTYKERIKYNIVFRTGISEGAVPHLGQRQFYHIGFYVDKRIGRKSALQLGTDIFFSRYLRDYIKFVSVAYPEENVNPNTDYKRISLFVGHELFINKLSIETQVGYYIYKPFKYEIDLYQRIGAKYYVYKNWFSGLSLKAHGGRAEAIEASIGVRL